MREILPRLLLLLILPQVHPLTVRIRLDTRNLSSKTRLLLRHPPRILRLRRWPLPARPLPSCSVRLRGGSQGPNAPPSRLYAYIGGVMDSYNEDLAVALLLPAVAKEDFQDLVEALKSFFRNLGVRITEVQPSPIGDAYTFPSVVRLSVSGSWMISSPLVMATR